MSCDIEPMRGIADVGDGVRCERAQLAGQNSAQQHHVVPQLRVKVGRQLRERLDVGDVEATALVEVLAVADVFRLVARGRAVGTKQRRAEPRP